MTMQKCYMCGTTEDITPFHKSSRRCKPCTKIYKKQYKENNREKIRIQDIEYRQNNKVYLLDKQRNYRANNSEMIREKERDYRDRTREERRKFKREYERKRLQDPIYRLQKTISAVVYGFLKQDKNNLSIKKYLPYSLDQLKKHLESQFESWMTWDNRGIFDPKTWDDNNSTTWTWQLDHIIPHSSFQYSSMEDQAFKDCWALSNLRPYSAKQNILDGVNRTRHMHDKQNRNPQR